jgi:hypothetical protein
METLIGIAIWVVIFIVWYVRTYPDRVKSVIRARGINFKWPRKRKVVLNAPKVVDNRDFKKLVEAIESVCARDKFGSTDAATMVQAVKRLMEIEPSSGQIWEAYALDSLETAQITCDDCRVPVDKIVKKTGVRIQCSKCGKWLVLKNSKVTIIDPNRPDLEDWEKFH